MKKRFGLALLLTLSAATSANATILTFDDAGLVSEEFADSIASSSNFGDTYSQDGFILTVGEGDTFAALSGGFGIQINDGQPNENRDNFAVLTHESGFFDLNSFSSFFGANSRGVDLQTSQGDLFFDNTGFTEVGLTGLSYAAFSSRALIPGNFSALFLDNVNVEASSAPVEVPAPASIGFLGLALAGLSLFRKKKA